MDNRESIEKTKQGFETSFSTSVYYDKQTKDEKHLESILQFLQVKPGMRILDRKTFVYTEDETYESDLKLYELEQELLEQDFIRISKQSVLNLKKIKSLKADINRKIRVTLQNGEQIIVSRMYSDEIRKRLGVK